MLVRTRLTRIALIALAAASLSVAAVACLPGSARATTGTPCGTVTELTVEVVKGKIPCTKARTVAKQFGKARHCGFEKEAACVVEGFHCRLSLLAEQQKDGVGAYCYVLKHPVPASRDRSGFHLSRFKKAMIIDVAEDRVAARR